MYIEGSQGSASPAEWITCCSIGFVLFLITVAIFIKEVKAVQSDQSIFTTKYLKWFALLSFGLAPFSSFAAMVVVFPGFCYISRELSIIAMNNQYIFLGFYQLSRLFYCFAQTQVHTNKGYPKCVFIILGLIGIILMLNSPFISWMYYPAFHSCGIKQHYYVHEARSEKAPFESSIILLNWLHYYSVSYFVWDVVTLLLYIVKILSFRRYKSDNPIVYRRIQNQMYRILILTLFYEVSEQLPPFVIRLFIMYIYPSGVDEYLLQTLFRAITSTIYSFTLHLMLQHNDKKYVKFIKMLHFVRVEYICCCFCCCKNIFVHQIEDMETIMIVNDADVGVNDANNRKTIDTATDTENVPVIELRLNVLSVETTLEYDQR